MKTVDELNLSEVVVASGFANSYYGNLKLYNRRINSTRSKRMSTDGINKVANIAIQANDVFSKFHEQSITSLSVTANAVVIDCHLSQQRLSLITLDEVPNEVGVAIGNKGTDESKLISQLPIDTLTSSSILEIMKQRFALKPA